MADTIRNLYQEHGVRYLLRIPQINEAVKILDSPECNSAQELTAYSDMTNQLIHIISRSIPCNPKRVRKVSQLQRAINEQISPASHRVAEMVA